jgi:hypothetical protein
MDVACMPTRNAIIAEVTDGCRKQDRRESVGGVYCDGVGRKVTP